MKNKKLTLLLILAAITSCTLAPNYKRPQVSLPLQEPANSNKKKISLITWQEYFASPDLQRVIQTALVNNRDMRVANLNIETAMATHNVVRADLFPTINAVGSETRQHVPSSFSSFMPKKQFRAGISLASFEIDFFGRLRSLKKAALEDFLASEQARNVSRISLIAETANAYTQLLIDREILKVAEKNIAAQSDRYRFSKLRYENGIDSQTTFLSAEAAIETAKNNFETYKKLVKQDENTLMLLMGVVEPSALPPQDITFNDIKINEDLLDLVPSSTLFSRPDIQQAEHDLKSTNADIGAARAAFFPAITLTGNYGYVSREMSNLFDSKTWSYTPQITMPLFAGGRNINNLKIAELRKKIEIAQYEKAIQTAFAEVSDQLAEREAMVNQVQSYDKILKLAKKADALSETKHRIGISSGLDVLDVRILLFTAEQNKANAQRDYFANLINLYKVMGGGSEVEESL